MFGLQENAHLVLYAKTLHICIYIYVCVCNIVKYICMYVCMYTVYYYKLDMLGDVFS